MDFRSLHQQAQPLLLSNVWDVPSAIIAEKLGFQAIGTSSAAISRMLGYEDGEGMSFEELGFFIKRIAANTQLPLSVDLEGGYSREPEEIFANLTQLAQWGVKGVNLEDSIVEKGTRSLVNPLEFSDLIHQLREKMRKHGIDLFFNLRSDCFLLPLKDPLEKCLNRIKQYEAAGADGIFVPGITEAEAIKAVVNSTQLPINVMCMPKLPDFSLLQRFGVKRISMGNFLFANLEQELEAFLQEILKQQSFQTIC